MTEKWKEGMCKFSSKRIPKCLLATFCSFIGIGFIQGKTFQIKDRGRLIPMICSITFCCFGAAYNRSKIRKFFRIKGNYFIDCLIYSSPLLCLAPAQEYYEIKNREGSKFDVVKLPVSGQTGGMQFEVNICHSPVASFHSNDFQENVSIESFQSIPEIIFIKQDRPLRQESESDMEISQPESEVHVTHPDHPDIGTLPLDGEDPLIYSKITGTGPFSFLRGDPYTEKCPPPTYLKLEDLKNPKPVTSKEIMLGMEIHPKGGLICVDKEAISKQKGVIGEVLKQVVSNISKGLGAVSISLPVRIFEPRSTAERLVDRFSYAPLLLTKASRLSDPVDRMIYVMAFVISGLYLGSKQEKPFNPLLGETFQGHLPDGTKIYVEHTAHNPPTDHFDVLGVGYRMFGYYQLDGRLGLNDLTGEFRGFTHIQFPGQIITFTQPQFVIGGTMYGDMTLNWIGEIDFKDHKNGISAGIRIGDDKHSWSIKKKSMKKDNFIGKIWKMQGNKKDFLATVSGSWLKKFKFLYREKKEKIWVMDQVPPVRHIPADIPLPSDWRFREDLIWLYRKNLNFAAGWKQRVENRQRLDRQLRGKH